MSRLTVLHINIIGLVVVILVGVALYFTMITSAMEQQRTAKQEHDSVVQVADTLPTARRALETAKKEKALADAQYRVYEAQYMPVLGYTGDRLTTMIRVFWPNKGRSWPERFIRTLRGHMRTEAKRHAIVWENPAVLQLGPYGPDPNSIDLGPVLKYTFPMAVRARNLSSLMAHVTSWPRISGAGVPVVEGLQISGNSPNLRASYNLTLTIIVHEMVPPTDPRVSGSGGGGRGGGGMMGGPPGLMGPGGPMGRGSSAMGPMGGPPMMSGGMAGPMPGGPMMVGPPGMAGGMGGPARGPQRGIAPMSGAPMGGGMAQPSGRTPEE
ncbi:MAG: hypothetical protein IT208_14255 [Chthonomonadales bacterium]|nr:hypothetical protein [Chthonomonadales bacterium]